MAGMNRAAYCNDLRTLETLLDEKPGLIEAEEDHGWRPLHSACHMGSLEAATLLLDRGADHRPGNLNGNTPFLLACQQGCPAVVSLLLSRGADPRVTNIFRQTGLIRATHTIYHQHRGHVAVLRLLLADGRAAVDARDGDGRTAIWWACMRGHVEGEAALGWE